MTSIKSKKFYYALLVGLLTLANLVLLNKLAGRYFGRLDLTETRMYSLSTSTKNILSSLGDIVTIDVYFSENVPQDMHQSRQWMYDLLDEYETLGRGNLVVKRHDIKKEGLEEQLIGMGIQPAEFRKVEKDKIEVAAFFMALVINSGDRVEIVQKIGEINGFEYEVTSRIYKVMHPEHSVGIYVPRSEEGVVYASQSPFDVFKSLDRQLSRLYTVRQLALDTEPIPPEVTTLIVLTAYPYVDFKQDTISVPMGEGQPSQEIPVFDVLTAEIKEETLRKIDDFLAAGGNLIVLQSPVQTYDCGRLGVRTCNTFTGFPVKSGIEDMLKSWGIRIESELLYDKNCVEIGIGSQSFDIDVRTGQIIPRQKRLAYGFWPIVQKENLNAEHPLTQDMQQIGLTWATPVRMDEANKADRVYTVLFTSSDLYGLQTMGDPQKRFFPDMQTGMITLPTGEDLNFDPMTMPTSKRDIKPPLAVLVEGVFPRYYKDETDETGESAETAESSETEAEEALFSAMPATPEPEIPDTPPLVAPGKLVVVGTGAIVSDEFSNSGFNAPILVFLANTVDYVELGQDLLRLRTQKTLVKDRPWKEISDSMAAFLKFFLLIGLSIVVALVGVVRWTLRSRAKYRYEAARRGGVAADAGGKPDSTKGGDAQ